MTMSTVGTKLGYAGITDNFDVGLVVRYIQSDLHFTSVISISARDRSGARAGSPCRDELLSSAQRPTSAYGTAGSTRPWASASPTTAATTWSPPTTLPQAPMTAIAPSWTGREKRRFEVTTPDEVLIAARTFSGDEES